MVYVEELRLIYVDINLVKIFIFLMEILCCFILNFILNFDFEFYVRYYIKVLWDSYVCFINFFYFFYSFDIFLESNLVN